MASRAALRKLVATGNRAAVRAARFAPVPGAFEERPAPKLGRRGVYTLTPRGAEEELAGRRALWAVLDEPPAPLFAVPRTVPAVPPLRDGGDAASLYQRLGEHRAALTDPAALAAWIEPALAVPGGPAAVENRRTVHAVCRAAGGRINAAAALAFAPFWVREPADFPCDPNGDAAALGGRFVAHLFERFPAPAVLRAAFGASLNDLTGDGWTGAAWLIVLGGGGGLRDAGRALGWTAAGRFQRCLEGVSASHPEATPFAAAVRAEVLRLGGDEVVARRLLAVPAFRLDPTAPADPRDPLGEERRAFWAAAVGWLTARGDALSDPDAADVLAWAAGRFERSGSFVWRGRSAAGALAAVRAAHERAEAARLIRERAAIEAARRARRRRQAAARAERERAERERIAAAREAVLAGPGARPAPAPPRILPWRPGGWGGWQWRQDGGVWAVTELTAPAALAAEGAAMSHCAGGYAAECAGGRAALFSLTFAPGRRGAPERRLTIEVDPARRAVRQARGVGNRSPTPAEAAALAKWVRARLGRSAARRVRRHG